MKWFVRADIDGFFGLALDNLVQLLVIAGLCNHVLGFSDDLVYHRILPAAAVSVLLGNIFYAYQAKRLAATSGRDDVCALPYGINTVSLFAYVFLVMLPAKLAAEVGGAEDPERIAWQAGLVACFGFGVIEFAGAFVVDKLRVVTPRAALLSTLAGIALTFIALGFLFRAYAHPVVGLVTLAVILLVYFGRAFSRQFAGRTGRGSLGHVVVLADRIGAGWRDAAAAGRLALAAAGLYRCLASVDRTTRLALSVGHRADGFVQSDRFAAEHRIGRSRRRPLSDAAVAGGQRHRHLGGRPVRLLFSDYDLYRPSGLEGDGCARRLFDFERRIHHADLSDRQPELYRLGGAETVAVIERQFVKAALWSSAAGLLSACGLIHSYRWTPADTALALTPAWEWALAYALVSLVFLSAKWLLVDVTPDP